MSKPDRLRYHPEAAGEADAALQWYFDRSPVAAATFLQELEHAAERILEAPLRWPRLTGKVRYLLPSFPFSVIYCVRDDKSIEALAVAHHRRRPGYWKSRDTSAP